MKKFFLSLLVIAFMAVVLSACGGDEGGDETIVKGEVVSVESSGDLNDRGIEGASYRYAYITIKTEEGKIHRVAQYKYTEDKVDLRAGQIIKIRYNRYNDLQTYQRFYDEDGLYLGKRSTIKYSRLSAYVILEQAPPTLVSERMSISEMPVGTWGYASQLAIIDPDGRLSHRLKETPCIRNWSHVRPTKDLLARGFYSSIFFRLERQTDGFHIFVVGRDFLNLNNKEAVAVLDLCERK